MVGISCFFLIKCILKVDCGRYVWYLKLHGEGEGLVRLADCSKRD